MSQGIGFEIARELGKCGITVIVAARQQQLGEEAREKIQASPGQGTWVHCTIHLGPLNAAAMFLPI
jgi:NAD(P)-dependent dehydrogenase (short-subunit alcohol dehydrogenase family)